jgi:hypothetical protein
MRHLNLELEKLEQRIAPGGLNFGHHHSGSKSKSKDHHSKSKSQDHYSKSKSKSKSK